MEIESHIETMVCRENSIIRRGIYKVIVITAISVRFCQDLIRQSHPVAGMECPAGIEFCLCAKFLSCRKIDLVTVVEHIIVPVVMNFGEISL